MECKEIVKRKPRNKEKKEQTINGKKKKDGKKQQDGRLKHNHVDNTFKWNGIKIPIKTQRLQFG